MAAPLTDLVAHRAAPPRGDLRVAAAAVLEPRGLHVTHVLRGDLGTVVLVAPAPRPGRRDRLWEHTCCEAFVGSAANGAYLELNVAPSGDWALWSFDGYRTGMHAAALGGAPSLRVVRGAHELRVDALLESTVLAGFLGAPPYRVGLSAVLEQDGGARAYLALRHPGERADFHDPAGWTLEVYPEATP